MINNTLNYSCPPTIIMYVLIIPIEFDIKKTETEKFYNVQPFVCVISIGGTCNCNTAINIFWLNVNKVMFINTAK